MLRLGVIFPLGMLICLLAMSMIVVMDSYEHPQDEKLSEDIGGHEVEMADYEEPQEEEKSFYDFIFPIAKEDFRVYSSPFGVRVSPFTGRELYHNGLDIVGVWRSQIVSVADGEVIELWYPPDTIYNGVRYKGHPIYGGLVKIQHEDGSIALYAHLSSTRVRYKQFIRAGEVIGRQGSTGKSRGEHLHFELWINDEPVNPLLYLPNIREEKKNG